MPSATIQNCGEIWRSIAAGRAQQKEGDTSAQKLREQHACDVAKLQTELDATKNQLDATKSDRDATQSELVATKDSHAMGSNCRDAMHAQVDADRRMKEDLERQIARVTEELVNISSALVHCADPIAVLQSEVERLTEERLDSQREISACGKKISDLEAQILLKESEILELEGLLYVCIHIHIHDIHIHICTHRGDRK